MEPVNDAIAAKVEALIGGNQSVCILDVACGCGQPSFSIADNMKRCSVVGVDSDSDCIEEAKRRFAVGNLYINRTCTGALVERHPFGGFKMSGIGGKAGGPDYLLQFVDARHVCENAMRRGFAPDLGSL